MAIADRTQVVATPTERRRPSLDRGRRGQRSAGAHFARAQAVNVARNAASLRPFHYDEFGTGAESPSRAHIDAANQLIGHLRHSLFRQARSVRRAARDVSAHRRDRLQAVLAAREHADRWIKLVERVWDFYLELFGQRQTRFGLLLLAADRIGIDCYQTLYTGLDTPRSIPAPPPLSYMETGFTPATFRRGVPLTRLGKQANPFPTIELPYHRLVNPWTLGAVHHEVSHNLQSDLGLWEAVPRSIARRLRQAGLPPPLADIWARWNKEIWADLCGLLLGGPAVVTSLIDVLARSPAAALAFNPAGVHPTPYLRTLISLELLGRIGFAAEAERFERLWTRLYPAVQAGTIPAAFLEAFPEASRLVVDTICFQPYRQLGGRGLAEVVRFKPAYIPMVVEAAERLAAGTDPGIIPARFLVGATRHALEQRLAPPGQIASHFYRALSTR